MYEDYIKELIEAAIKDLDKSIDYERYMKLSNDYNNANIREIKNHIKKNIEGYYFSTKGADKNSEVWKVINKFHNSDERINTEIYKACEKLFEAACKELNLNEYTFDEYLNYNSSSNTSKINKFRAVDKYIKEQLNKVHADSSSIDIDTEGLILDLTDNDLFNEYDKHGLDINVFALNNFHAYCTKIKNLPRLATVEKPIHIEKKHVPKHLRKISEEETNKENEVDKEKENEEDFEEPEQDEGYQEQDLNQRARETLVATKETINKLRMQIAEYSEYIADYDTKLEEIEDRLFDSENLSKIETLKLNNEYKKLLENRNFWAKSIEEKEKEIRSLNKDIQELSTKIKSYKKIDKFGYDDLGYEDEMGKSR